MRRFPVKHSDHVDLYARLFTNGDPSEEKETLTVTTDDEALNARLVLYNDDYHTFDFVIESLQTICDLDQHQAEQLTLLVHYKGKATCKRGSQEKLDPMCAKLREIGLDAEVK
jgi:ATP-dependent Clp protease adaptor protein ClpS